MNGLTFHKVLFADPDALALVNLGCGRTHGVVEAANARLSRLLAATPAGKIDVLGDIHGCFDATKDFIGSLGWSIREGVSPGGIPTLTPHHPDPDRKLVLLGDLVTRGDNHVDCLRLSLGLRASRRGDTLMGNHDWQLFALLTGYQPPAGVSRELREMLADIRALPSRLLGAIVAHLAQTPDRAFFAHPAIGPVEFVHAGPVEAARMGSWRDHPWAEQHARLYGALAKGDGAKVSTLDWKSRHAGDRLTIVGHYAVSALGLSGSCLCLDLGQSMGGAIGAARLEKFHSRNAHAADCLLASGAPIEMLMMAG